MTRILILLAILMIVSCGENRDPEPIPVNPVQSESH